MIERTPQIEYPCPWNYRVIGDSEAAVRAVVERAVVNGEWTLEHSNTSRGGKYVAMKLMVIVSSEQHRIQIGRTLNDDPRIHLVL